MVTGARSVEKAHIVMDPVIESSKSILVGRKLASVPLYCIINLILKHQMLYKQILQSFSSYYNQITNSVTATHPNKQFISGLYAFLAYLRITRLHSHSGCHSLLLHQ